MSRFAKTAVQLGLLRVAPAGTTFPGRKGASGMAWLADIRGALAVPPLRRLIVRTLSQRIRREYPNAEMVVGLSKAGVAWAALAAWDLALPGGVVHLDGPRQSGLQRQVEGAVAGRSIVLIDNLTRTHFSLIKAAQIIEAEAGLVAGALTVAGCEMGPAPFRILTLCSEDDLIREGLRQGVLTQEHF